MINIKSLKNLKKYFGYFKYKKTSYSQEGEDLILDRLLNEKANGFYVDVGAHHPTRFSNTYFFYKKGWQGINIDATPGSMKAFQLVRPRDINLEIPVSEVEGEIEFYEFDEPALNGFSREISLDRSNNTNFNLIGTRKLRTQRLDKILSKYLPDSKKIDFLSVDVEGLDLEVLKSCDWDKYSPGFVLVEILDVSFESVHINPIYQFLKSKNYELTANSLNTYIFRFSKGEKL